MNIGIIIINSGSTSLKFAIYQSTDGALQAVCSGGFNGMPTSTELQIKGTDSRELFREKFTNSLDHGQALSLLLAKLQELFPLLEISYAGHRIVLGGDKYLTATILTNDSLDYLEQLSQIEPTHQYVEVKGARALAKLFPQIRQAATFDTSYHRSMPEVAEFYPVPPEISAKGVRHWGFHGISYAYISRQVAKLIPEARKVITAHLGGGASLCAMLDGKSIDTSMQFGAITGVPMATRSGDFPADAVFYLLKQGFYTVAELESLLEKHSGLLGASLGLSENMRILEQSPDLNATKALACFEYAVLKYIGAYVAALNGLDVLVFTAGIGENDANFRARIASKLEWLGVSIDLELNALAVGGKEAMRISPSTSKVAVWVIPTNEELMIAQNVVELFNLV